MLAAYIDDNDIRSDLLDVFIGDDNVGFRAQNIEKFISTGNDNLADLSAAMVKFKVGDSAKLLAVT